MATAGHLTVNTSPFWREDQSMVPVYYMMVETETYPEVEKVYYPVAGGINPIMKIGVASVNWGRIHWMDLGDNQDVYIPAMDWLVNDDTETQEQKLVISYLNRKQNHLELWLTDPKKGSHDVIFTADDTCFWKWTSQIATYRTDPFYWFHPSQGLIICIGCIQIQRKLYL